MSEQSLCVEPNPILRSGARRADFSSDDLRPLVRDLLDTMYAHDGIGLAAPQIGRDVSVFVANPSQKRGEELVIVNPEIVEATGRVAITEGCLSLPSIWDRVKRASRVRMRGYDAAGNPLECKADGLLAIVLQHEFDHLQGRLFIDRLSWLRRRRVARKLRAAACA